jgi:hypothetical protein
MLGNGGGPWVTMFIYNLNMQFFLIPFPFSIAELIGDSFYNRQRKANMFLSVITAPIPVYWRIEYSL